MGKNIQYYVEGQDEKKLLSVLKTDMQLILPGKIQKFNVIQDLLKQKQIMQLKQNTTVVLVFDTDTKNTNILRENIKFLMKCSYVKNVICITQVFKLEDEIIRSCNIHAIKDLFNSTSNSNFKSDLLKTSNVNVKKKLLEHQFDFNKFWILNSNYKEYNGIQNEANLIKQ